MLLVPAALITGVIEDKIANDLTSNDNTTKKHLKEVEKRILQYGHKHHKSILYDVQIFKQDNDEPLSFIEVTNVHIENNFLLMTSEEDGQVAITLNGVTQYRVKESSNTDLKLKL